MVPFTFGPLALTGTYTTNLLNVAAVSGGTGVPTVILYILLKHIRFVNTTSGPLTFRMFLGASAANAAGTQVIGYDYTVAANSVYDWYSPGMRMNVAQFLVGGASSTGLTIEGEGMIGVAA